MRRNLLKRLIIEALKRTGSTVSGRDPEAVFASQR